MCTIKCTINKYFVTYLINPTVNINLRLGSTQPPPNREGPPLSRCGGVLRCRRVCVPSLVPRWQRSSASASSRACCQSEARRPHWPGTSSNWVCTRFRCANFFLNVEFLAFDVVFNQYNGFLCLMLGFPCWKSSAEQFEHVKVSNWILKVFLVLLSFYGTAHIVFKNPLKKDYLIIQILPSNILLY